MVGFDGEWTSVESYLQRRYGVRTSHGISPAGETLIDAELVIPDSRAHPVYRNVPTVKSLGVAAYLGAPLVLLSGEVIGAFCAVDFVPRSWTEEQVRNAADMASLVVTEIELRQLSIQTARSTQAPSQGL